MAWAALLLRRAAALVVTAVVASFIIFAATSLTPGNPAARLLGSRVTPALVANETRRLGLDHPLMIRYWTWLSAALHGNLGESYEYRQSVGSLLGPRLIDTATLVLYAAVITVVLGILLGVLPVAFKRAAVAVTVVSNIGIAVPSFVAAALLIAVFGVETHLLPVLGAGSGIVGRIDHLTLPALALAAPWTAFLSQITRAELMDQSGREHVDTARGRGLSESLILRRHVLRNGLVPVLTTSGMAVGGLIVGTVVVEQAFGIQGIGSFLDQAVATKDVPVVQVITVIFVVAFVAINSVIDLVLRVLDPRRGIRSAT